VARESHFGQNVLVTRKGAVRAREEIWAFIPGSMGTRSYIVRGKGNAESFHSCSHGAGRAMSRHEAKKRFTVEDHIRMTEGVECRKDADVIDETPAAYKPIDAVMAAQTDLVGNRTHFAPGRLREGIVTGTYEPHDGANLSSDGWIVWRRRGTDPPNLAEFVARYREVVPDQNIRAKRHKPGLLRQHLTAVQAAAEVGSGEVDGAVLGSKALTFVPGKVRAGDYHFAVGTAGSGTLVLQTILPALMTASAPSASKIEGRYAQSGGTALRLPRAELHAAHREYGAQGEGRTTALRLLSGWRRSLCCRGHAVRGIAADYGGLSEARLLQGVR